MIPEPPLVITEGPWGKQAMPCFLAASIPSVPTLLQAPGVQGVQSSEGNRVKAKETIRTQNC